MACAPVPEHLARRAAHLVGRVAATRRGDEPVDALDGWVLLVGLAPVAMAARLREARPGEEHARAAQEAALDRLREPPVEAERVPHRGEAGVERLLEHVLDAERQRRGRLPPGLARVGLDDRGVHVRVGEPGHQRATAAIDARRVARQVGFRPARHLHDPVPLDDDGRARRGVGASAVEQGAVLEDDGARRGLGARVRPSHSPRLGGAQAMPGSSSVPPLPLVRLFCFAGPRELC